MTDRLCFVQSSEFAWVPASLLEHGDDGETAAVSVPIFNNEQEIASGISTDSIANEVIQVDLNEYSKKTLPLQNVDGNGNQIVVADLKDLMFLNEPSILYNLKVRHLRSKPYTRSGTVMIAVNPFQWIQRLYTPELRNFYSNELIWAPQQSEYSHLDPHVYEVSALAYRGLAVEGRDQSILVSGESGAGKTETVKICLHHLASIQSGPSSRGMALAGDKTQIVKRILDSNPLLEAFGNAKTRRNDNSSRFGKYLQLQFHHPNADQSTAVSVPECQLVGSANQVYLLEKSRVVHHEPGERTFHIFYQILAAPDSLKRKVWKKLKNKTYESYAYVGATDTTAIEGIADEDALEQTLDHLKTFVRSKKLDYIMKGVCAVMQMGNVSFADGPTPDSCAISSMYDLEALSGVLGVPEEDLEFVLTYRTVVVRGEKTNVPLRPEVAKDFLDALAKQVYASIFNWLVNTINDSTSAETELQSLPEAVRTKASLRIIGLLDIFGFEYFESNGFEQLCINFANEMLQSKFTLDVFETVFEEYASEGLSLDRIGYDDNTNVLDLIQTPRSGLMSALNEECILPKGNDEAFCRKFVSKSNNSDVFYVKPGFDPCYFGIRHYAADIVYDCRGFVTKNKDTLPMELVKCLVTKSTNPIIVLELTNAVPKETPSHGPTRKKSSALVAPTVWTKYRSQMSSLMDNLRQTKNWYIRCIKPNEKKQARLMQQLMTVDQLRSAGVIAAVTMSRAAFPNRLQHKQVLDRFGPVWNYFWCKYYDIPVPEKSTRSIYQEEVENLLSSALKPLEVEEDEKIRPAFAVGRTRAYFVAGALEYLEAVRFKGFEYCALRIQQLIRGAIVREYVNHEFLMDRIVSRKRIQTWWRCMKAKKILHLKKHAAELKRQEKSRQMQELSRRKGAATSIQAAFRGRRQREKYDFERSVKDKDKEMDDDLARLEKELLELEELYESRAKRHTQKMADIEEQRKNESDAYFQKTFGESFSSLGSSVSDFTSGSHSPKRNKPTLSPITKKPGLLASDEVAQQRKANKKLRKTLFKLEQERAALEQNISTLAQSNRDAKKAFTDAKGVYLKLVVRNNKLSAEADMMWEELAQRSAERDCRVAELEAEKHNRAMYLKTIKKVGKLVHKRMPNTRLATDVDRVVTLYVTTERRRLGKGVAMGRQDSARSLTSITSATEHSDSESDLNDLADLTQLNF